jgi:N-acetylmuramic acid 6-phosphate etherase
MMRQQTEGVNERSRDIDLKSIPEILSIINAEDRKAVDAVESALPDLVPLIEKAVESLSGSGRIFYVGAGTSGRLGVIDAAECPPTYGFPAERFVGIIVGGLGSLVKAHETAEDDEANGRQVIAEHQVGSEDVVVGISASGGAPFVCGALREAHERGAVTGAILCNQDGPIAHEAEIVIRLLTGPEVISGSTRMKAATAQKMLLTSFSTTVMVKLGRVTGNFMTCMRPTNAKLRERAKFIVSNVTGVSEQVAGEALEKNGYDIRKTVQVFRSCQ